MNAELILDDQKTLLRHSDQQCGFKPLENSESGSKEESSNFHKFLHNLAQERLRSTIEI
jgi:hypothetical protein